MSKLIPIGGDVGYGPMPEGELTVDQILGRDTARAHPVIRAMFRLYEVDNDLVHEVELEGASLVRKEYEPSLEDRQTINGFMIVRLLLANGIDMHDFKEILLNAMFGIGQVPEADRSEDTKRRYAALDKMHYELGGME